MNNFHDTEHDMYKPDKRANRGRGLFNLSRRASGDLSPGEERVAALAVEGYADQEIADLTSHSVATVKALLHRVYQKRGVDNGWGNPRVRLARSYLLPAPEPAADIPLVPLDTPQRVA